MNRILLLAALILAPALYGHGIKGGGGGLSTVDASAVTGTIDISVQTNLAVSGSTGSLVGDTVTLKEHPPKECFFGNPVTGHSDICQLKWGAPVTVTEIHCNTTGASATADIEFEERAEGTPNTAGTEVMGADLSCDTDGAEDTTFSDASIAADAPMSLKITAVANAPTALRVYVKYTYQ